MLQVPTNDRKTKSEASSKTAEYLPEYEQSSQSIGGIGRFSKREASPTRQSHSLPQRENLAALQKAYGNQAVLRMKGRSPAANPVQGVLQRKCACGNTAGSSGSCAECQSKQEGILQTKLQIGEAGDRYEQEADRVAKQVMAMRATSQNQPVQREKEEAVQTKPLGFSITPLVQREMDSQGNSQANSNLENQLNRSKGGGTSLSQEVRGFMEPRFGADFSGVRVHTGSDAAQMSSELGAQAFTNGADVYFGEGKSPGNNELTAHELTHVAQQDTADCNDLTMARILQRQPNSQNQETDLTSFQCGVRTVELPSPGNKSNYVVLKSGANTDKGILFITNVGKCRVFIHGIDANGQTLAPTNPLQLDPGEYAFQFTPPPDTAMIVGITTNDCSDYSALSYDPCTGIA